MSLYWPYLMADYYRWLEYSVIVFAVIILLSSIDDLFIDGWYWFREIRRGLSAKRHYKPLLPEQLRLKPEQHIAIMIPAWLEYDVIASMLENMVKVLDYRAYTIFVGTYCNDSATITEVERMRRRYKHLVRVEVPHNGPTCKADCLNWVVQAIFAQEAKQHISYAGVVLHDSEDVLHPLELQFFNYLLPRKDLIQIPVASLERNWYELVAGVYMDEFAEWHGKDLVVRESLAKTVPSAGVGTCFFPARASHTVRRDGQSALQYTNADGRLRYRRAAGRAWYAFHSGTIPGRVSRQERDLVRLWQGEGKCRADAVMRARVFPQYVPHILSPESALVAGYLLSGVGLFRLARLACRPLFSPARPQGSCDRIRGNFRLCACRTISFVPIRLHDGFFGGELSAADGHQ